MKNKCWRLIKQTGLLILFTLTACSGGGGSSTVDTGNPPPATTLSFSSAGIKQLTFDWPAVSEATYYKFYQDPDGVSGYTQVGADLSGTTATVDIAVHRHNWPNARYLVEACNADGCTASNAVTTTSAMLNAIGYVKASNTAGGDSYGYSVAVSGDGATLAVGAYIEDSNATGIDGNQADNTATGAGAVYVYTRASDGSWSQQAYVKASNTGAGDRFGWSVSVSADGNTLAVGASYEDSIATGIDGNHDDNMAAEAGAVYVFTRTAGTWSQQAYVKASNTGANDSFGYSLGLSADGNTLAVGAYYEGSNTTGIDGNQDDNTAANAGAVYVFTRTDGTWSQQAYVKASNTAGADNFGGALTLSADGNTLAVGATGEDGDTTGIDGDQVDNSASNAGAVYVFARNADTWSQQAYVKASNTGAGDFFGYSLALSADGNTLAAGGVLEASAAAGIDGNQDDNTAANAGAVYVFTRTDGTWSQQAYVKASNTGVNDSFGWSVALSNDGNTLAVGAIFEDSNATGIDGNQADNAAINAGAAYVFTRSGSTWSQQAYVKASNTGAGDYFGYRLALNADGSTLVIGAVYEASATTGINGDQADNTAINAGAVYLY